MSIWDRLGVLALWALIATGPLTLLFVIVMIFFGGHCS